MYLFCLRKTPSCYHCGGKNLYFFDVSRVPLSHLETIDMYSDDPTSGEIHPDYITHTAELFTLADNTRALISGYKGTFTALITARACKVC